MKRILPFIRLRNLWFIISFVVIAGGIAAPFLLRGGYNVGIDFKGGLSQQIRIAPLAFTVTNVSNRVIEFEVDANREVSYFKTGEKKVVFTGAAGLTLAELAGSLESTGDLTVAMAEGSGAVPVLSLVAVHKQLDPEGTRSMNVNREFPAGTQPAATTATVREVLSGLPGGVSIQEVGAPENQTFLIRTDPTVFTPAPGTDAADEAGTAVIAALEKRFGTGYAVEQSRESLGPQMAQTLAVGSVIAIAVALVLMLVYAWIRFRLNFAVAAILALVHDVATSFAFIGIFGVELNTAVVAALLTILGYSINDTVVVYDRIRENEKIMKGQDLATIMEYSISQTLARTFITSFTLFIAIFPLFLFGTGPVKDFSFTMVFGIITGTYSTICIASPIALLWQRGIDKAKRRKEIKLYGQVRTQTFEAGAPEQPMSALMEEAGTTEAGETIPTAAPETAPGQAGSVPPPPYAGTGTGPITRVQRVLEKKKKRRH